MKKWFDDDPKSKDGCDIQQRILYIEYLLVELSYSSLKKTEKWKNPAKLCINKTKLEN